MPRVSFIVPVRNAESTVTSALACLALQTFKDFEVLVFDDGSTDKTRDIIDRFAAKHPEVKRVDSARVGLVQALGHLIANSDAEFLARMDADDLCRPDRLEVQLPLLLSDKTIGVVGSRIACFPEEALTGGMRRYESWLNSSLSPEEIAREIFVESPLCHPSVVMRRDVVESVGGYLDDGKPEDYGLWLRLHTRGHRFAKSSETLLFWRESERRLTRTHRRYEADR